MIQENNFPLVNVLEVLTIYLGTNKHLVVANKLEQVVTKLFLSSTECEILIAHKHKNSQNQKFLRFKSKSIIYPANKC